MPKRRQQKTNTTLSIKNYAKDNAKLFGILPQAVNETGAEFRERVARELHQKGERIRAQETLSNAKESGNPFAYGSLDSGYGDDFITRRAQAGEAAHQEQVRRAQRPQRGIGGVLVIVVLIVIVAIVLLYFLAQSGALPH